MLDKLASALDFDRQALGLRFERQKVLAGNIANADTPNFKARDFDFSRALAQATARDGSQRRRCCIACPTSRASMATR